MFGKCKELKGEIRFLESEIEFLERENEDLKNENDRLKEQINSNCETQTAEDVLNLKCSFEIDFKKMNVFSIERICEDNEWQTIVGYILENKVETWYLYCSPEQHNEIVEKFRKWKQ